MYGTDQHSAVRRNDPETHSPTDALYDDVLRCDRLFPYIYRDAGSDAEPAGSWPV